MVAWPISSLPVAAISNLQNSSSPQISSALCSNSGFANVGSKAGSKVGSRKATKLCPGTLYAKRLSLGSSIIPIEITIAKNCYSFATSASDRLNTIHSTQYIEILSHLYIDIEVDSHYHYIHVFPNWKISSVLESTGMLLEEDLGVRSSVSSPL